MREIKLVCGKKIRVVTNPPICWLKHKMRDEKLCKKCKKLNLNPAP